MGLIVPDPKSDMELNEPQNMTVTVDRTFGRKLRLNEVL